MKRSQIKLFSMLIVLIVGVLALSAVASAAVITEVQVNDYPLEKESVNQPTGVTVGDDLDIKVRVRDENADHKNVRISAEIAGYDYSDEMRDITGSFDITKNTFYVEDLTLHLRERLDKDTYALIIEVEDKNGIVEKEEYTLRVEGESHLIKIRDITVYPEVVQAGRSIIGKVQLRNYGDRNQDDVEVTLSIPELGVTSLTESLDIKKDDKETTEEIFIEIPRNARSGDYTLKAEVVYKDGDKRATAETTITVEGKEGSAASISTTGSQTVINVGTSSQQVIKGVGGAVYPITITNQGAASKAYTVSADGAAWASFQVTPTNVVVVEAGKTQTVYVYASAKDSASAGENSFTVTVATEGKTEQIPLKATVVDNGKAAESSGWGKVKKGLEVGLVVLVVLLVILGLIIGFNKLKEGNDDEKEEGQTYY